MLAFLSIFIGVFLIMLGIVAIYIGVRTYLHLHTAQLITSRGDLNQQFFFSHGLADADTPGYFSSRPFCTLVCTIGVGLLPFSFGVLLFVRIAGIF